jgi:hypothetical protein
MFYNRTTYSPLHQLLMEAEFKVLLEAKSPAEIKAKLGIKKNDISDEDFKKILDAAGNNRLLVVAMVGFYLDERNIDKIVGYTNKFNELEIKNFNFSKYNTFKLFTEKVDSIEGEKNLTKDVDGFNLESTPPDYQTRDGKIKVYEAKSKSDCIKYGKGYTFCIADMSNSNMYHTYRRGQESKYYFVFDLNLDPAQDEYITVVDAQPEGKFEFTHKRNNTSGTSHKYNYSLEGFFKEKPKAQELASVFKPEPRSKEELAIDARYSKIEKSRDPEVFSRLSDIEFDDYIERGYILPGVILKKLNNQRFVQFINRNPFVEPNILASRPVPIISRFFKVLAQNNLDKDVRFSATPYIYLKGVIYDTVEVPKELTVKNIPYLAATCNNIEKFAQDFNLESIKDNKMNRMLFVELFFEQDPDMFGQEFGGLFKKENVEFITNMFDVHTNFKVDLATISQFMLNNMLPPEIKETKLNFTNQVAEEFMTNYTTIANSVDNFDGEDDEVVLTTPIVAKRMLKNEIYSTMDGILKRTRFCTPGSHYAPSFLYACLKTTDHNGFRPHYIKRCMDVYPYIFVQYPELIDLPELKNEDTYNTPNLKNSLINIDTLITMYIAKRNGLNVSANGFALRGEDVKEYLSPKYSGDPFFRKLIIRYLIQESFVLDTMVTFVNMDKGYEDPAINELILKIAAKVKNR